MDPADFTDAQIARLRRELATSIARIVASIRADLGDERVTAQAARGLLQNLLRQYEALFGRLNRRALGITADVLDVVGAELADSGIAENLTTPSEALLRAQAGDTIDRLAEVKGARLDSLREAIAELSRSTVNPVEAVERLRQELDATAAQALVVVDTGVAAVDRTLSVEGGVEAGFELFLFDGPVDERTRPWCAEHVGQLHTRDEMDEDPNGVGPEPPSAYGGGYGCRHRWSPVDRSEWRRYPRWQGRPYPDEVALEAA